MPRELVITHGTLIGCGFDEHHPGIRELRTAHPEGLRFPCDAPTLAEYVGLVRNLELNIADAAAGLPDEQREEFERAIATAKRTYERAVKAAGDKYREQEAAAILTILNGLVGK